jgi:hypothetical protein
MNYHIMPTLKAFKFPTLSKLDFAPVGIPVSGLQTYKAFWKDLEITYSEHQALHRQEGWPAALQFTVYRDYIIEHKGTELSRDGNIFKMEALLQYWEKHKQIPKF